MNRFRSWAIRQIGLARSGPVRISFQCTNFGQFYLLGDLMRGLFLGAATAAVMLMTVGAQAGTIKAYKTEGGAQKHCPKDEVVWGNSTSSVHAFHVKGSKGYGTTKNGAY